MTPGLFFAGWVSGGVVWWMLHRWWPKDARSAVHVCWILPRGGYAVAANGSLSIAIDRPLNAEVVNAIRRHVAKSINDHEGAEGWNVGPHEVVLVSVTPIMYRAKDFPGPWVQS